MVQGKARAFILALVGTCIAVDCLGAQSEGSLRRVRIPNDSLYWSKAGFVEMVPPLRLPTDLTTQDAIRVWVKVPEGEEIGVRWLADQARYSLVFPSGSELDRVELMSNAPHAMQIIDGIEDVRGARIGHDGRTYFHVYEPVPGQDPAWLEGFEWLRSNDAGDDVAADSLIALYYAGAAPSAQGEIALFRRLNQCGACHQPNLPFPNGLLATARPPSDANGFFQPLTVLDNTMLVRVHRPWDLNAEDPFITVRCGVNGPAVQATTSGNSRTYTCPSGQLPVGTLDLVSALRVGSRHARAVCVSRLYLYDRMNAEARRIYRDAADACQIERGRPL